VEPDTIWVEPEAVVEVRYKEWPPGHRFREPTFIRVRDDKDVTECAAPAGALSVAAPAPPAPVAPALKNANKVFFPGDGITKGDLVAYYDAVAPWLLPYLRDRPLMLTRYPDGIDGKSFFQKGKPAKAPDFIRTIFVHNEEEGRDIDQIICDDARTLHWCATMAAIPLHLPAGRVSSLGLADWCVVDFDPKGAPFEHVIELALGVKSLCDALQLPAFVKTSGSSGLHVLIPLGRKVDHEGAKQLAEVLAALLVARFPRIATTERTMSKRQGRVYVDAFQNGTGKLIASPFCVRAKPGAPVSMPLRWPEVRAGLTPTMFTIRDAIARLEREGDPMAEVLTLAPDIAAAVARVASLT
ncbi:MAG: non-homologous end-joining DNA ligase, partial [Archangium sp.]|nr:non-homologous end-joining DNA ligase [Archangium sp.]